MPDDTVLPELDDGDDGSAELTDAERFDEAEADQAAPAQAGLLRNSAIMASGSIISRITGVLRITALTAAIGLGVTADAFALGRQLPDIVYVLVIGGALNAIFVPQLVRRMRDDADEGRAYTDSLISATSVLLIAVTAVSVVVAPWIIDLYATDSYGPEQLALATAFARFCLPQVFFFGLYTMLSQVLNARERFGMPMYAPVVNNLVVIAAYVSFAVVIGSGAAADGQLDPAQITWLGLGTTLGVVAQAVVLIPVLVRSGYRFRFSRTWRGMGLGKAGRLAGWTIGLVAVTQVAFVVISRLATQANVNAAADGGPAAGLATYTNAYLVFMIPHGIVTVSIVTAQLPGLSRMVHAGQLRAAGADIGHTMRLVGTVITPLVVALTLGAQPLTALLFDYGAANSEAAAQLGVVIEIFMVGLLPFTLYYVLQRGWYASEDTRTPFWFAVLMNTVLVAVAVPSFAHASPGGPQVNMLAAAYSLASLITFLVAWPVLRRKYGTLDSRRTLSVLGRVLVAGVVATGAVGVMRLAGVGAFQMGQGKVVALLQLTLTSAVVLVVFAAAAWLLRVPEMRELLTWVARAARLRR